MERNYLNFQLSAEWRSRDENAENLGTNETTTSRRDKKKSSKRQRATSVSTSKGGSKSDSKLSKRFSELAEILQNDTQGELPIVVVQEEQKGEGVLKKIKNFYKQADDMAAAQALLLNKKLEEGGVLEKITDESGLKVIGKEAATKLSTQESAEENSTSRSN